MTDGPILDLKASKAKEPEAAKGGSKPAATKAAGDAAAPSSGGFSVSQEAVRSSNGGIGVAAASLCGIVGGIVGAGLFVLSMQGVAPSPKAPDPRLDALEKKIATLAQGDALTKLDKRLAASEQAATAAEASAKSALERADQALKGSSAAPAAGTAETPAPSSDLAARLDALDQRVSALQEEPGRDQPSDSKLSAVPSDENTLRLADLDERLKAVETKSAQPAPTPPEDPGPKLAALEGTIDTRSKANEAADQALGQRIDQIQQSLDRGFKASSEAAQQAAAASRQAAEAGQAQAQEAIKTVDRRLAEQADKIAGIDKALEGSARAATLQAAVRVVAADRIATALQTGAPFADALATLRGGDPGDGAKFAPLAGFADSGAPNAARLSDLFRPIAEQIAAAQRVAQAQKLAESGSIGDRLKNMAESIVQVKRVNAVSQDQAPSGAAAPSDSDLVSRVQAALERGNVDAALQAYNALPANARASGGEFGTTLGAVVAARSAARSQLADAFKGLSAPAGVR